jgi:glutamyl-tRNA(Gln) amidotransferase subunit E
MPITPRPIPAYGEVPAEAYRDLGLRVGLEVHQQLRTRCKLFCRCPANGYRQDYDAEILRHMRPTLSEMGEYDGTALMEKKTRKEIIYQITGDTTCTYEMDDSPPFMINPEAVDIALDLALLLGTNIVGELQIARKQYLDGSIPTGFQRTAILGLTGSVPFRGRKIRIRQLAVEEDACREIADRGHRRIYRTDRLSRPLSETVTEPDMRTPEEAAAVCRLIARMARSTGRVRTGIGAAREDVNVSVAGSTRVEIKGVPRIPMIPVWVHYEAYRQRALLDIREALAERGLAAEGFEVAEHRFDAAAAGISLPTLDRALAEGGEVRLLVLPGFRDVLGWPIGPTRRFASELSDLARVVACLDRLPNLGWEGDGAFPAGVWARARGDAGAGGSDGLLLLWGPERDVRTAADEIAARCRQAFSGVPNETRQALPTGENRFERVLPGPDRMYPDTDLPPLGITDERIDAARRRLPLPVWEAEERMTALGVPPHEAYAIAGSPASRRFFRLVEESSAPPRDVSRLLVSVWRGLTRGKTDLSGIAEDALLDLLARYAEGEFAREAFPDLLKRMAGGESAATAIETVVGARATDSEIDAAVRAALEGAPAIAERGPRIRNLMGRAMKELRGRADGRVVAARVGAALEGGAK